MRRVTRLFPAVLLIIGACTSSIAIPDPTSTSAEDPAMRGPHAVGRMTRIYQRTSTFDGTIRDHETFIWYPAALGAGQVRVPDGNLDAPVERSGAPYPLIVWSHGLASTALRSSSLIGHLVSHGFVVVGTSHLSDCQPPSLAAQTGSARVCPSTEAGQRIDQERPLDLIAVLDAVLREESLSSLVDRARIAVVGYSQGGLSSLDVAARDDRFKAVLGLAPYSRGPVGPPRVPTMLIAGAVDALVPIATVQARFSELPRSIPKWLVTLARVGHNHFHDGGCLDRTLTQGTCTTAMPVAEAQTMIIRWSTAFLLTHVAGTSGFERYLDGSGPLAHPDVTVTR